MLDWILASSRLPDVQRGDLTAMFGACNLPDQPIQALLAKYGGHIVNASIKYAQKRFRAEFLQWPDRVREGAGGLDQERRGNHDNEANATVTIAGSDLGIDFPGSSPGAPGLVNSPSGNTVLCGILTEDVRVDSGVFRALSPLPPAPCTFSALVIDSDI